MSAKVLLEYVLSCDVCLFFVALWLFLRSRTYRELPFFGLVLGVSAFHYTLSVGLLYHRKALGVPIRDAFPIFFYSGWITQILFSIFTLLTIYNVYRVLMRPLRGLHRIGNLLFRWVGGISILLASVVVFGPHPVATSTFATLCGQVQEGVAILTICLVLAVSFATRPLGLTFRSKIFGVILGLGLVAATDLVQAAWLTTNGARSVYSPIHLVPAFSTMAALSLWVFYLVRAEPMRKLITLPTTSPFFFWNRIAEALGDAPGEVVVGGISPDMFSPAELLAFRAAPHSPATVIEMPQVARR